MPLLMLGAGRGYTASDDLQDVNNWRPLYNAYNAAMIGIGQPSAALPVPVANSVLFGQSSTVPLAGLARLQDEVGFRVGNFPRPPATSYTFKTARAAAGLPLTLSYSTPLAGTQGDNGPALHNAFGNRDGFMWRRERYREIMWQGASWDISCNPATAGQLAYMVGSNPAVLTGPVRPTLFGTTNVKWSGTVWRCVAPGNWVRDGSGARPDIIDNLSDPPNCLIDDASYTDWDTGSYGVNSGNVLPRDIINWFHLEELRAVIELMH